MWEAYLGEGGFVVEVGAAEVSVCGELEAVVGETMVGDIGAWAVTGKRIGARGNGDKM